MYISRARGQIVATAAGRTSKYIARLVHKLLCKLDILFNVVLNQKWEVVDIYSGWM